MRNGPLDLSAGQVDRYLEQAQAAITNRGEAGGIMSRVTALGTAVGTGVAGLFLVLFGTYFFMADGERIWAWVVRLAPRAARERIDESGRVAWISLTQFVKATVLVALFDAVCVMVGAAFLGVPFVMAIGVLVFLGAFVPLIGAAVAGSVAVLIALVDQGPGTALAMLGVIVIVQQVEGQFLQPVLMGRFVSLHPLAVIAAIGCGVIAAGIVGALIAVPLAAAANAVVQHLASEEIGEDAPHQELEEDLLTDGVPSRPFPPDDSPVAPTDVHKPLEDRP
jgi:predicted PurR-regulated permease PerM